MRKKDRRTQTGDIINGGCLVGYSDYDVFLENDEGSQVYRCKKLF